MMDIWTAVRFIWDHLVTIFGTVFVFCAVVSFVVSLMERRHFHVQRKEKQTQKKVAVITGASSGLGRKYARVIDRDPAHYDVDEIWLIARRKDRLDALAKSMRLPVRVFPLDLTEEKSLETLRAAAEAEENFCVTVLLNCAGFGRYGSSGTIGAAEEGRMIDLNDKAAIAVTDLFVPFMQAGARIGEVCSVAAFQPIPYFNCYAASKSFLYSYSRSLRVELLPKGISVTAICPYWVRDTEFIETAAGQKRKVLFSSRSDNVVRLSLWDLRHRHGVSTPGVICTLDRIFAGLIPDGILGRIASKFL